MISRNENISHLAAIYFGLSVLLLMNKCPLLKIKITVSQPYACFCTCFHFDGHHKNNICRQSLTPQPLGSWSLIIGTNNHACQQDAITEHRKKFSLLLSVSEYLFLNGPKNGNLFKRIKQQQQKLFSSGRYSGRPVYPVYSQAKMYFTILQKFFLVCFSTVETCICHFH